MPINTKSLIIAFIALALFLAAFIFITTYLKIPEEERIPDEDVLIIPVMKVNLHGYMLSCMNEPLIQIKENGSWRDAKSYFAPKNALFFLDGELNISPVCDYVVCNPIENPISIELVEYEKIEEIYLYNYHGFTGIAPVYKTVKLKGEINVSLKYFTDKECKNEKTFSTIVNIK